jgi:putative two-component system response regulator
VVLGIRVIKKQKKIIIVDDNNANLTAYKHILKQNYEVFPVISAAKMFDLLRHVTPDMILLDVDMPDMNGYETAGRLKKNEASKSIPFIFLSSRVDATSEAFGLNMGALDYIHKPIASDLLLKRLELHFNSMAETE